MKNLGDFAAKQTVRGSFNSQSTASAPITLAGTPSLAVYKDGSDTQSTEGVTLTVDFDSVTGHHLFEIVTTNAFYAAGSDYRVVIAAGTVDSVSVVGTEVACFSIENRSTAGIKRGAFFGTDLVIGTVSSTTEFIITDGPKKSAANLQCRFFDTSVPGASCFVEGSYVYAESVGTLTVTEEPSITIAVNDTVTMQWLAPANIADIVTAMEDDGTSLATLLIELAKVIKSGEEVQVTGSNDDPKNATATRV